MSKKTNLVETMLATEVVPLSELVPDSANIRTHDERNRGAISGSLKQFGAARSIVVDGNGIVRAGNGTLEAARAAGIEKALVVDVDGDQLVVVRRRDWSPTEATAYAIADNRTGDLSTWNDDELARTLAALKEEEFPVESVGFTEAELQNLLASSAPLKFVAGGEETGGSGSGESAPPPEGPPVSHVRMVQLFLNTETFPEFNQMIEILGERYGTDNATDTVMACLREMADGYGKPDQPATRDV
jgi:hypothetical protein